MGVVAQSPTALPRVIRIAAVPTAAFLAFAMLVARRMGRPINDARGDSRGRARIPNVRGSQRRIGRATDPRQAATGVGIYDHRAGCLDVQ